ncbi:polyphosphate--glucose phosphotransferase [Hoyosella altamirensis]|uniref:Polyphosphate glucokinase n=1 Tax=Hoyosella altamirensis TaxID=616997 RepID=A0A839RPI7_9ACTN|nr:ROK family protein [Hoyosella altamirensis]MBB3038440.1 polyphosphate glucokinase [Hoyosella altamirensis]
MHTEPQTPSVDSPPPRLGLGVDIGGSGVKGAVVNLETGVLATERIRIDTPQPATPEAVAATVAAIVKEFDWDGPVGITVPAVVKHGVTYSAANIDPTWIGTDARALFTAELDGRKVTVLNDADAAGLAEQKFGSGRDENGLVILLTFGTGIGSALLYNGTLIPNSELGHLEVGGKKAEHRAAASVRERNNLSWTDWAAEVSTVLSTYDALFSPDLFIAGGGVSKKSDKWIPLLTTQTRIIPAQLRNTAGIVGGAVAAYSD